MTMITPSYLGETIEYSSLHACRSTLEDPTGPGPDSMEVRPPERESAAKDGPFPLTQWRNVRQSAQERTPTHYSAHGRWRSLAPALRSLGGEGCELFLQDLLCSLACGRQSQGVVRPLPTPRPPPERNRVSTVRVAGTRPRWHLSSKLTNGVNKKLKTRANAKGMQMTRPK